MSVAGETVFRRSSYCAVGACVEVARASDGGFLIRDAKDSAGTTLTFTPDEWSAFIAGVRNGEFDQ